MNKLGYILKKHAPDILSGVSIVAMGFTGYFAAKGALKAEQIKENERPRGFSEKASMYIRSYWMAALCFAGGAASVIFARKTTADRIAAITAVCTAAEENFRNYRKAIKEELGEDKEHEIYLNVVNSSWNCFPELPHKVEDYDDTTVFYDVFSDRYFVSSIEKVQQAMYHINRDFRMRGYAFLNEFYYYIGIDGISEGDSIGWEEGDMMEMGLAPWIDFYASVEEDDIRPKHFAIIFEIEPTIEAIERVLG